MLYCYLRDCVDEVLIDLWEELDMFEFMGCHWGELLF